MVFIFYFIYVYFGFGIVNELKSECVCVGICWLMIVMDKGVVVVGLVQCVIDVMGGLFVIVFDEMFFNLIEVMVLKVMVQYKDVGCDGLIVIGGGLFIDLVKGIVIVVMYLELLIIYVIIEGGSMKIIEVVVLLIVIFIMVGIGSEVVCGVIIILEDGCKFGFYLWYLLFKLVICDVELMFGLLFVLMVVIGMDVIVYCIEIFLVLVFNLFVDGIVLDGLECVWVNIECVMCDGVDCDVCLNMMSVLMQGVMVFQKGLGCVYLLLYLLGGVKVNGKMGLYYGMLNVVVLLVVLCFNEMVEMVVCDNCYVCMCCVMNLLVGVDFVQVVYDLMVCLGLLIGLCQMGVFEEVLEYVVEGVLFDYCYKINLCIVMVDDYCCMLVELM